MQQIHMLYGESVKIDTNSNFNTQIPLYKNAESNNTP